MVSSKEIPFCPTCNIRMKYRDMCRRIVKDEGGNRVWIKIQRYRCCECGRLHRAIPNIIVPYKHYRADVICGVLDGIIQSDDEDSEDYPCERTMERWFEWLRLNINWLDKYYKKDPNSNRMGMALPSPSISLLGKRYIAPQNWLEELIEYVYSKGGHLQPSF